MRAQRLLEAFALTVDVEAGSPRGDEIMPSTRMGGWIARAAGEYGAGT